MFDTVFVTQDNITQVAEKIGIPAEEVAEAYERTAGNDQILAITYIPPETWQRMLETLPTVLEREDMTVEEFQQRLLDEMDNYRGHFLYLPPLEGE